MMSYRISQELREIGLIRPAQIWHPSYDIIGSSLRLRYKPTTLTTVSCRQATLLLNRQSKLDWGLLAPSYLNNFKDDDVKLSSSTLKVTLLSVDTGLTINDLALLLHSSATVAIRFPLELCGVRSCPGAHRVLSF
jgi:hypothetical protein